MAHETKQRFVDLSVGEVSLVDSPANEQEFIVVKRLNQEDGDMADVNTEVKKNEAAGVAEPVASNSEQQPASEKVQVEVAKATNEAVEKAMAQVTDLVENIAKAVAPTADGDETTGDGETTTPTEVEKGKSPDMRGMYKGQLEAAGVKGESLEKAMAAFDKKFKPFAPGKDTQPPQKTQKNVDGEGATTPAETSVQDDDAEASVQKMLEVLAVGVQKAKAFTPKREEALKQAIETLTGLMKELGMQKIPTGGSPSTTVPAGTQFGGSGVVTLTKGLDELKDVLKQKLDEIQEVSKSLGERLETIEKTRNPSTSVEGEGGTDTQDTQKSFWTGIL